MKMNPNARQVEMVVSDNSDAATRDGWPGACAGAGGELTNEQLSAVVAARSADPYRSFNFQVSLG